MGRGSVSFSMIIIAEDRRPENYSEEALYLLRELMLSP